MARRGKNHKIIYKIHLRASPNFILSFTNEFNPFDVIQQNFLIQPGFHYKFNIVPSQIATTERFDRWGNSTTSLTLFQVRSQQQKDLRGEDSTTSFDYIYKDFPNAIKGYQDYPRFTQIYRAIKILSGVTKLNQVSLDFFNNPLL
jgi:hypothetical protein